MMPVRPDDEGCCTPARECGTSTVPNAVAMAGRDDATVWCRERDGRGVDPAVILRRMDDDELICAEEESTDDEPFR